MHGHSYQEFFILRNMKPVGPEIGRLGDIPLHEAVEDEWGRTYRYVGIASRVGSKYAVNLGEREFILPPGVVYRMLEQPGRDGMFKSEMSAGTRSSKHLLFSQKPTSAGG
jgi:hypothetical protein